MKHLVLAAAVLAFVCNSAPAWADDDDLSPARMQKLDERASERGFAIDHAKAIAIAKANGVVTLREIDLEDNEEWKVEGRDAQGREIEVELSARDGKVREIERN